MRVIRHCIAAPIRGDLGFFAKGRGGIWSDVDKPDALGARKIPVGIRGEAPAGDLRTESPRCWSNFVNAQQDI